MNLSRRGTVILFATAMLPALCSFTAMAQNSSSGTVAGQITDQQGAAIPGVEIQILKPATSTTLKTTSNDAGRFIVSNVSPGSYNITMSKAGFSTRKVFNQDVNVGEILNMNAVLEIGAVTNVVEVTSSPGAELQTVNASVGTTVSGPSLTYLPIFGSDASSLAIYQPGVSPEGAVAGECFGCNEVHILQFTTYSSVD